MEPRIRLATEGDADGIAALYAPIVRETPISFELEPPDAAELARRVRETLEHAPWLVCEEGRELLGYAYAGVFRARPAYQWTLETTVYVDAAHRRRRVARSLYVTLLDILRAQGFQRAIAGIALPNEASVRLHESLGFEPVGTFRRVGYKLGRWHDVGFWELALGDGEGVPPPRSLEVVGGTSAWDEALTGGAAIILRRS